MSGEVGSMPSFTRSGRPCFSFCLEAALGKDVDRMRVRTEALHAGESRDTVPFANEPTTPCRGEPTSA